MTRFPTRFSKSLSHQVMKMIVSTDRVQFFGFCTDFNQYRNNAEDEQIISGFVKFNRANTHGKIPILPSTT